MHVVLALYGLSFIWMLAITLIKPDSINRLLAKCCTSALFVVLAIVIKYRFALGGQYFTVILLALVFSFLGDVFLGLSNVERIKHNRVFIPLGFSFFFVAQCFYVIAFTFISQVPFSFLHVLIPIVGIALSLTILLTLKVKDKLRFILVCVYTVAMAGMLSASFAYALHYGFDSKSIIILSGGIVFAISDYTLLFKYFYTGKKKLAFVTITTITYYAAQLLMIATLLK